MTGDPGRRPLIGVTAYRGHRPREGWGDIPVRLVTGAYVDEVEHAGGVALLIPARPDLDEAMARDIVARLDGLLLVGGDDIDPAHYRAATHPATESARDGRDETELALARAAWDADLPTLGVCRGMQVLAVALGGTLEQHLPDRLGHNDHASVEFGYWPHRIDTVPGTFVAGVFGASTQVVCHHHQGVCQHPGFVPAAWSEPSGDPDRMPAARVLEAMEAPERTFFVGVQSHPEEHDDNRVFAALVAAAAARRVGTPAGPPAS